MVKQRFPEYLRIHTAGEEEGQSPIPERQAFDVDVLCQKFHEVTGSQLEYGPPTQMPRKCDWLMEIEGSHSKDPLALAIHTARNPDAQSYDKRENIEHLAGEIGWLIDRLNRTERALWEREGELAVGIPVTAHPESEGPGIAERLEAILRCGALAVDCSAAALYMLDDATTLLKLRSQWGFAEEAFLDPPRRLRGARGDLEALSGHAVVIQSKDKLNHWDLPDQFSAAVCIPVSTMTMPLGTLWIYSEVARDFSDKETELIEIIAGRIAVELEREVLIRESVNRRPGPGLNEAVAWQQRLLPASQPSADGWDFGGCGRYEHSLHGDHCFWHTRADGSVFATLSGVLGDGPEISLASSFVAGAMRSMCEVSDLSEVLVRINGALWSSSSGDQLVSMFASEIDPTTGQIRFVATGDIKAFVVRPHGWEPLLVEREYCGGDESIALPVATQYLEPDDVFIVLACAGILTPRAAASLTQPQRLAEVALHHNHLPSAELVSLLRDQWDASGSPNVTPPAILVFKRFE